MSKPSGKTARPRPTDAKTPAPQPVRRGVTMREIGAVVGVHQTTVSLALRNHPSLPETTRARIRRAAEKLGYRPNPLLSAFNFHRVSSHPAKHGPTLAMVFDARMRPRSPEHEYPRLLLQAAREAATQRGFRLEPFILEEDGLNVRRLDRVLAARGISGVIISTLGLNTTSLDLNWKRLCAVKIESRHATPALDAVSNDQWQATRIAFQRLRVLGYRRVGLATCLDDEARLGEPFRAGFLVEQAELPAVERVPPLLFEVHMPLGKTISEWARNHRVDAVISNWNNVREELGAVGWRVPAEIAVASLDLPMRVAGLAGVRQNHALVGRRAVEHLITLLHAHQRGVPTMSSVTFVPGTWHDGDSAPVGGSLSA